MSIPESATHLVRGYDRKGRLLVETWHRGDASKNMEVSAWKARYDRGEISRVEVIDRNTYKMETYPPWPEVNQ